MRRLVAWLPFLLLAALIAAAALVLLRGGERHTVSGGAIGRSAPRFELARLGGGEAITNEAFAGRVYVVNLFASWCVPCRAEHPVLMALKEQGVEIVGVAYKDDPAATAAFLRELGDPFAAVALDPDGRFGIDLGIAGVPETFVIGPDGAIRAVHRGPLTDEVVARVVTPALEAP
jgi:cytochrome c biogenesis protein CcmG, thiol:disulfide interchange protein DsbE